MTDGASRRAVVVAQLRGRRPLDAREEQSLAATLDALDSLAAPFDRHAGPTHVTGSGIVVGPQGVLLLRHLRLGIWVQPGGHLEPDETPWAAARRETVEETGLDVRLVGDAVPELVHVDVHQAGPHRHLDLRYLLRVEGDERPRPPAGESQEVRWVGWPDAVSVADDGLAALLRSLTPPGGRAP